MCQASLFSFQRFGSFYPPPGKAKERIRSSSYDYSVRHKRNRYEGAANLQRYTKIEYLHLNFIFQIPTISFADIGQYFGLETSVLPLSLY